MKRIFYKHRKRRVPVFREPEHEYQSLPELVLVPAQPLVCLGDYRTPDPGGLFPWSLRLMMPGAWTKLPGDGGSVPEKGKHGILGAQGQEHLGLNVNSPFSSPWTCYLSGHQPQNNNSPELQVKEILL
ncbi:uncharacterized protein C5orf67 [Gorilla gorilla gorilla]|uniref:Uncharacterized protein n=1 Tax=Gorilla gorilla gorilla TaxID=9595 RepID=G3RXA3_GORGO